MEVVQAADFLIKAARPAAADVTYKITKMLIYAYDVFFDAFKNQRTETEYRRNRIRQQ
jgi:hypothetical protein